MPELDLNGWTIVFDLDGTLIDTAPDLLAALNHVLATVDVSPIELTQVRHMIGRGAKAMIRSGLTQAKLAEQDHDVDRLWRVFLEYYQRNIAVHSAPFPGLEDTLDVLADAGATLTVCTNKTQALSERLLEALRMSNRFAAIVGADAVAAKKPHRMHFEEAVRRAGGRNSQAIMIGDSDTDAQTAAAIGAPMVFASFGYGPEPQNGVRVDAVLDQYATLPATIQAIAV